MDRRVAPGRLGALGHLPEQLLVQRRVLAARADEAVSRPPRQLRRQRSGRRDVDRHRLLRLVVDRRLLGPVPLALEVHALLGPEQPDQLDRLGEPLAALLAPGKLLPRRGGLVQRLAGAHSQEHAPRRQPPERAERLRDHRRVVAERGGEDAGAERGAFRRDGGRAEPGQRRGPVPAVVAPGLEVVRDGDDLEPDPLRVPGELEQLDRPELLRGCLVAELHATSRAPPRLARGG